MIAGGFVRACRYFIRQAEYYVCFAVVGGFAAVAYVCLLGGESNEWQKWMAFVPHAAVYFAMVILFANGFYFQYMYALPVSLGCARKYVFCGILVMEGLVMAETMLFDWILTNLLQLGQMELMIYLGLFLLVEGLSKFGGIIMAKWGRKAQVVMTLILVVLIAGSGFAVGYAGTSGAFITLTSVFGENRLQSWRPPALVIGAVVCFAANVAGWQLVKDCEVRS